MRSLQAKRQKVVAQPGEESDEEHVPTEQWPVWVVCNNSYALWRKGMQNLPTDLKFNATTVGQVAAVKYWAAQKVEEMQALQAAETYDTAVAYAPQEELQPPAQMVAVQAVSPHAALQVDQAVRDKVEAIKAAAAAARASPNTVVEVFRL